MRASPTVRSSVRLPQPGAAAAALPPDALPSAGAGASLTLA